MNDTMRSFVLGLLMGLFGNGLQGENASHYFDSETGLLMINRDDGSLDYAFSDGDFSLVVTEV